MTAEVFLDSNILLYACSTAPADAEKQSIAERLILETDFALSAQVLQEFVSNALRKGVLGISEQQIAATMELSGHVPVLAVTRELVLSGIILRRRFQVSHWDSTIIAAAREIDCHTLYSEDLNHGQDYDGVQVINPFIEASA
jgi:predicted nucleic acid-binding protein